MKPTNTGCLDGKVMVITGAGRGIGRDVALLAAAEGAKVVVNDLGTSPDGSGDDSSPANEVVNEIRSVGGEAVSSHHNVADVDGADAIIQTALRVYGQIDTVVNNAGILRDRIFHKMTTNDFESVVRVHLFGSFYVARAAAGFFREQQRGTFVHMTSTSGLVGNYGQANYAAAKLAIVGLSKSIALDMARYNVRSNCIAPFAWSRLIGTIPTDSPEEAARVERVKTMATSKVAPLVVYLAADLSEGVTGQIFGVRKNEIYLFSQPRPIRSLHCSEGWTPQTLADRMRKALQPSFYALDRSSDVFSWEPI